MGITPAVTGSAAETEAGAGAGVAVPGVWLLLLLLLLVDVSPMRGGEDVITIRWPGVDKGEGTCSAVGARTLTSEGDFSPPGDATPAKEGELNELDARGAWPGRRGGGGAGAWTLTRRLEERDLVESTDDRRSDGSLSS